MFITSFTAGVFATIGAEVLIFILTFGIVAGMSKKGDKYDNNNKSHK